MSYNALGVVLVLAVVAIWIRLAMFTWTMLRNPVTMRWMLVALLVVYIPVGLYTVYDLATGGSLINALLRVPLHLFTVHVFHVALILIIAAGSALFGWMTGRGATTKNAGRYDLIDQ